MESLLFCLGDKVLAAEIALEDFKMYLERLFPSQGRTSTLHCFSALQRQKLLGPTSQIQGLRGITATCCALR